MGLNVRSGIFSLTMVVILLTAVLAGCAKKEVIRNVNKLYIDCCNPTINAEEKDMCKWAKDNPGKIIVQGNTLYTMIWSDCKVGEEPWRKWE